MVSILVQLPIVSKAFKVSLFFCYNRLDDPLAVPPKRCSLLVAPPTTKVLDHPKGIAMNGQVAGTLKIGDEVNRLESVNTIQGVGGLGVKMDSLGRH